MKSNKKSSRRVYTTNGGSRGIVVYIVAPLLIICAVFLGIYVNRVHKLNNAYDQVDYIASYVRNGELQDYANKIGMRDPEKDIRWYKDGDTVQVEFGYMNMMFEVQDLLTEQSKLSLGRIGINFEVENNKLVMYYNGQLIERWVK